MGPSRILLSMLAAVAALLVLPGQTAHAGLEWCAADPILRFADGTRVQWVTKFSAQYIPALSGPVEYRYEVPSDAGPITVQFAKSPVTERVTISYSGSAWEGKGDRTIKVTVLVPAPGERFTTINLISGNVEHSLIRHGESNAPVRENAQVDPNRWWALVGEDKIVSSVTVTGNATVYGP